MIVRKKKKTNTSNAHCSSTFTYPKAAYILKSLITKTIQDSFIYDQEWDETYVCVQT